MHTLHFYRPLFVKDYFAWTPAEFAYLVFVSSVVSALVVASSTLLERRYVRHTNVRLVVLPETGLFPTFLLPVELPG